MSKQVDEPIEPPEGHPGHRGPTSFQWRGRRREVTARGGHWSTRGRWWLGEGDRHFFRLTTQDGLTLDLCEDQATGQWTVAAVLD